MKPWLLGVIVAACGTSKAPGPVCDVNELRTWLANLAADDQPTEQVDDLKLVALDAYPNANPEAVRVSIGCDRDDACKRGVVVTSRGELYDSSESIKNAAALLSDDLRTLRGKPDMHGELRIALLVDGRAPWASVAAIIGAIGQAGVQHLSLGFTAGKAHAKPPGPSSIDGEVAAFDKKESADLERDPGGTLERSMDRKGPLPFVAAVYENCPQASALVADILSERLPSNDKSKAIADKLPAAVEACGCKIETHALERLIWRLYARDTGHPVTWVVVELAKDGAKFEAAATATWSTMHAALVSAARAPIAFE